MKPEEMDRLFRDELEKLENVPGIEWNDDISWNKINNHLKGGWSNLLTSIITVAVTVTITIVAYHSFSKKELSKIRPTQEKNISGSPVLRNDSIVTITQNKNQLEKKKNYVHKKQNLQIVKEPFPIPFIDTTKTSTEKDSFVLNPYSAQLFNRYRMTQSPLYKTESKFLMPSQTSFRFGVNQSFNFSNLIKSINADRKAEENSLFIYEYNQSTSPFPASRYPGPLFHNRQILINNHQ